MLAINCCSLLKIFLFFADKIFGKSTALQSFIHTLLSINRKMIDQSEQLIFRSSLFLRVRSRLKIK